MSEAAQQGLPISLPVSPVVGPVSQTNFNQTALQGQRVFGTNDPIFGTG